MKTLKRADAINLTEKPHQYHWCVKQTAATASRDLKILISIYTMLTRVCSGLHLHI